MLLFILPLWTKATIWGLVSGSALLIGALAGYYMHVSFKVVAFVMAFGSGVLISALALDLMQEAYERGGFDSTAIGFLTGAVLYSAANYALSKKGAKHRKRSGHQQPSEEENSGSGLAIAVGSLLDGIPESIAIGVSMIEGGAVSTATVIAIFLSNIPESLSSTSGMKKKGRPKKFIFLLWTVIAIICGACSLIGYSVFKNFAPDIIGGTIALAAGAILAMISATMIPEAFEQAHDFIGVITVIGFLVAFLLTKL